MGDMVSDDLGPHQVVAVDRANELRVFIDHQHAGDAMRFHHFGRFGGEFAHLDRVWNYDIEHPERGRIELPVVHTINTEGGYGVLRYTSEGSVSLPAATTLFAADLQITTDDGVGLATVAAGELVYSRESFDILDATT